VNVYQSIAKSIAILTVKSIVVGIAILFPPSIAIAILSLQYFLQVLLTTLTINYKNIPKTSIHSVTYMASCS